MASDVEQDGARIAVDPGAVRQMDRKQAGVRFAAGAGASLAAALVSEFFGSTVAGPLLALPAILIASLTFIAGEDGLRAAVDDSRGAVLGALGLVAFAVVCWRLLGTMQTWLVLLAATAAWAATSLLLYALQRGLRRAWKP